ncbi:ParA family protein [Xanthomonas oryzae]|uniref:ParA family protein n=1 Tax=Xanthomonas oryzae TaxID=347 RepID=UPI000949DFD2|nr:ParA family protein [Xanthomonas oryzae]
MKILSVFNNKGGVGKTTLTYHLAHALSEEGNKVLLLDADPQCNLTIYSMDVDDIHSIWEEEDECIYMGVEEFANKKGKDIMAALQDNVRSLHFLLQPTIDGVSEHEKLAPPYKINKNLHMIPGRLSLHEFEGQIQL